MAHYIAFLIQNCAAVFRHTEGVEISDDDRRPSAGLGDGSLLAVTKTAQRFTSSTKF